jgi:hypothetical protein
MSTRYLPSVHSSTSIATKQDFPRINAFFDALELIAEKIIRLTSVSRKPRIKLFLLILPILHFIDFIKKWDSYVPQHREGRDDGGRPGSSRNHEKYFCGD